MKSLIFTALLVSAVSAAAADSQVLAITHMDGSGAIRGTYSAEQCKVEKILAASEDGVMHAECVDSSKMANAIATARARNSSVITVRIIRDSGRVIDNKVATLRACKSEAEDLFFQPDVQTIQCLDSDENVLFDAARDFIN